MSNQKKSINLVIISTVLAVLLMGANAKRDKEVKYSSLPSTALSYASWGPHMVGMRNLEIDGESPLAITVWYPAPNVSSSKEKVSYRYELKMGDPLGTASLASYEGQAIRDATYNLLAGKYPLVILSPGF